MVCDACAQGEPQGRNNVVSELSGRPAPGSQTSILAEHLNAWERGETPRTEGLDPKLLTDLQNLRKSWEFVHQGSADPSPRTIAGRVIERELGRGGFGVVYLARHPSGGRPVAIKQPLMQALLNESTRRRFLREGELAAGLDHPNIVPVLEIGEDAGVPHIISEYVEGTTVSEWLNHRGTEPVPIARAIDLTRQIAAGIAHAHQRGVLHRDIKPENILVDANGEHPRITDFGLGRALDEDDSLSASHAVIGTASHMAPEQAAGRRNDVDVRSEIWAMGVILYRLLSGKMPFNGAHAPGVLLAIMSGPPKSLREHRPEIPRDLEAVCQKCLKFKREDRYDTADRLIEDLDRVSRGEPTIARPRTPAAIAWGWAVRHPVASLLGTVMALVMVAGPAVIVGYREMRREVRDRQQIADFIVKRSAVSDRLRETSPGWINRNLEDLRDLAAMRPLDDDSASALRSDWFATLAGEDWEEVEWTPPARQCDFIAISPDGKWFSLARTRQEKDDRDFEVWLYDARTLKLERTFRIAIDKVRPNLDIDNGLDGGRAMVFSPDGNTLYVSTRGGWIHAFGIDGVTRGSWKAIDEFVADIDLSRDGSRIFVAGRYSGILKTATTSPLGGSPRERMPNEPLNARLRIPVILMSPGGNHFDYECGLGSSWRFDINTLAPAPTPPADPDPSHRVWDLQPNKTAYLANRSWGMSLERDHLDHYDLGHAIRTDKQSDISRLSPNDGWRAIALSEGGRSAAVVNREMIMIWDVATRSITRRIASSSAVKLQFLAGGDRLMALGDRCRIYERRKSSHHGVLAGSPMLIQRFALSEGDRQLVTLASSMLPALNSRMVRWDIDTDTALEEVLSLHTGKSNGHFTLSPDGRHGLLRLYENALHFVGWNPRTDLETDFGDTFADSMQPRVFMPDGKSFWVTEQTRLRRVSTDDLQKRELSESLHWSEVEERYNCLMISRGKLVAGRGTGKVDRYDATNGAFIDTIDVSNEQIITLAEFTDGRLLVADALGKIWWVDPVTGKTHSIASPHVGRVPGIRVHPCQTTMVTGGEDGQVLVWKQAADGAWKIFARLPTNSQPVRQIEFDATGARLYVLFDQSHHVQRWKLDELPPELDLASAEKGSDR